MDSIDFFHNSRTMYNYNGLDKLSSGNNLYPTPSIYQRVISNVMSDIQEAFDYQEAGGTFAYRSIIAQEVNYRNKCNYYNDKNVFITMGSTDAIDLVVSFLKFKLDYSSAYYTLPCYYTYIQSARFYGYDIIFSEQIASSYDAQLIDLLNRTTSKSIVYINNPNSITGVTYTKEFFCELFQTIKAKKIYCIVDEIIGSMPLYNDDIYSIIDLANQCGVLQQLFILSSLSKNESLPGIRVGTMLVPHDLASDIESLIRQRYVSIPSFASKLLMFHVILNSKSPLCKQFQNIHIDQEDLCLYIDEKESFKRLCRSNIGYLEKQKVESGYNFMTPIYGHSVFLYKRICNVNYWDILDKSIMKYRLDIGLGPFYGGTLEHWVSTNNLYIRINVSNNEVEFRGGVDKCIKLLADL